MNTKAFLVLLLSFGWIWFCQHWHCCWITQSCMTGPAVTAVTSPKSPHLDSPLIFDWSASEPITNNSYNSYASSLMEELTDDNILEITGTYESDEPIPDGYDNMGMARAEAIRDLLSDQIAGERVRLVSMMVSDRKGSKEQGFVSHTFKWIKAEVDESEIVRLADKTIILFPFNSASNKTDPKMDAYLSDLAQELKSSRQVVHLTGHTDGIGSKAYNKRLGMKRARKIRRILIAKGVRRAKIKLHSEGMAEPVATNDTDEGRSQNRRVVVTVEE